MAGVFGLAPSASSRAARDVFRVGAVEQIEHPLEAVTVRRFDAIHQKQKPRTVRWLRFGASSQTGLQVGTSPPRSRVPGGSQAGSGQAQSAVVQGLQPAPLVGTQVPAPADAGLDGAVEQARQGPRARWSSGQVIKPISDKVQFYPGGVIPRNESRPADRAGARRTRSRLSACRRCPCRSRPCRRYPGWAHRFLVHETLDELRRRDGAAGTAADVLHIGDVGPDLLVVFIAQRHAPDFLLHWQASSAAVIF